MLSKRHLIIVWCTLASVYWQISDGYLMIPCNTCFQSCEDYNDCPDCSSEVSGSCFGRYCFVRMDILTEGPVAVQKGCSNFYPGDRIGCFSTGPQDSPTMFCYCDKANCNHLQLIQENRNKLITSEFTCCSLSIGDTVEELWQMQCHNECQGTFCYTDFVEQTKGCGYGQPHFNNDLIPGAHNEPEPLCIRHTAGSGQNSHSCVCNRQRCNKNAFHPTYSREQLKCHSCHEAKMSAMPTKLPCSDSCNGQYCYITLTSANIVQEFNEDVEDYDLPVMEKSFEVLAGCIQINRPELMRLGCKIEWQEDGKVPLTVHCVCNVPECNNLQYLMGHIADLNATIQDRKSKYHNPTSKTAAPTKWATTVHFDGPTFRQRPKDTPKPTQVAHDEVTVVKISTRAQVTLPLMIISLALFVATL